MAAAAIDPPFRLQKQTLGVAFCNQIGASCPGRLLG
jgi:hypothetical protein